MEESSGFAVLAREKDKRTGEVREWVYVNTLPLGQRVDRWVESMGGGGRWKTCANSDAG